jgi:hypothetical protein
MDMVFDEQAQWNWSSGGEPKSESIDDSFTVEIEYSMIVQRVPLEEFNPRTPVATTEEGSPEPMGSVVFPLFSLGSVTPAGAGSKEDVQNQIPLIHEDDLDVDHDEDAPLRVHNIHDIIGPATPRGLVPWVLADELHVVSSDEPSSFENAEQDPCWRHAMLKEMKSIEDNDTRYLADLPSGHRAIELKWVYKVKRDEHGDIVKHKARLVVKGYSQRRGIDYDEVFAPVARLDSVRLLITLAAHQG